MKQDRGRAAALHQRACDLGEPVSCVAAGMAYDAGKGVPVDKAQATQFFVRACDAGLPIGCGLAGQQCARGEGVSQDDGKAIRLLEKACEGGEKGACERVQPPARRPVDSSRRSH